VVQPNRTGTVGDLHRRSHQSQKKEITGNTEPGTPKILSVFLLCRSWVAREVIGLYLVWEGGVQLIVFLTDIKNTLERKIYESHKQGR
jgi:hypothetical protein